MYAAIVLATACHISNPSVTRLWAARDDSVLCRSSSLEDGASTTVEERLTIIGIVSIVSAGGSAAPCRRSCAAYAPASRRFSLRRCELRRLYLYPFRAATNRRCTILTGSMNACALSHSMRHRAWRCGCAARLRQADTQPARSVRSLFCRLRRKLLVSARLLFFDDFCILLTV